MAANKITIKFNSQGERNLLKALKNLAKAQDELLRKTKKFGKAQDDTRKGGRLLNNAFATMRSKILLFNFAMALGVKQLIGFSKEAAKVESMTRAFNTLSGGADKGSVAISKLKEATNNTMSEFDLFQQANNAMVLGITKNSDEMAEMFDVAQRLGRALGKDTAHSVESLITGIGRQSRLMLDNIGIIVKADEAYEKYAKKLDTTVDKLSDADKKTAFLEATMESARAKVASLGAETLSSQDSFDAFSATMSDLSVAVGDKLKNAFTGAMNAFVEFINVNKEADVEAAVTGVTIDGLVLRLKQLQNELEPLQELLNLDYPESFTPTGAEERAKKLAEAIAATTTQIQLLNSELVIAPAEGSIFDLFPEFDQRLQTNIQVMDNFNQEAETLINDFYIKRLEAGLEFGTLEQARLEQAAIDTIEDTQALKQALLDIEDHFTAKRKEIKDKDDDDDDKRAKRKEKLKDRTISSALKSSAALLGINEKNVKEVAALQAAAALVDAYSAAQSQFKLVSAILPAPFPQIAYAASIAQGIAQAGQVTKAAGIFEDGGLVGGRRHSQGGTMIEAEQGEFVMSRNAVNAVGVEAMNRINQGGGAGSVVVNVSGNVMSQDYVEGELANQLKEAIRRGADIGVS